MMMLLTRMGLVAIVAGSVLGNMMSPHILKRAEHQLSRRDANPLTLLYKAHNFSVPVDHFHNEEKYEPHSEEKFPIRYWYDATYYKPGGPVIALSSGETSGEDRLPFLQKGIVNILAKATNGIGVILEHRYYGTSFPVPDLSVKNLRFLTTEQALADTAYLAENIVFEGLEDYDLTASDVPWIVYGGSYAGAFVAFLRVLYPDTFWGAISSSGVPEAIIDYWKYWEPIRQLGPQECIHTTQDFVEVLDGIVIGHKNDTERITKLKATFGLPNITETTDFVAALANYGIGAWQGRNWDPAVSDTTFERYCGNITNTTLIYPRTSTLRSSVESLIGAAGQEPSQELTTKILNWIGFTNTTLVNSCAAKNQTQDQCYSSNNQTYYDQQDYASQSWRSWAYQYCTEWGYYQTGSGVPSDIRPLLSRTIDVPYGSIVCRLAFNITTPPDISVINRYGGLGINYTRLAFIDGQADPWKEAGPHASDALKRLSTWAEPFMEVEGAVHHWDENGLFANETTATLPPEPVKAVQNAEVAFVKVWLREYWSTQCKVKMSDEYMKT
ncbi:extracelular serine carboxypeptidase [Tothia fuscella]|uniref:Extracelular serine carboxypeptidase n=1 Tax=Tothia fuscella TaxID=1048955 RepID=A0A9P4TSP4_9PEZI|nr:extracelular serine carboxypeptidase [Tothia fuscella]